LAGVVYVAVMSNSKSSSSSGGTGFFGLLTIAFVVLKLTNVIDWSWWWVLSPIIFLTVCIVALIAILCCIK
jgi:hypothetical protein